MKLGAIDGNQQFELDSEDISLIQMNFNCTGTENKLEECSPFLPMATEDCEDSRRNAYIVCQGI